MKYKIGKQVEPKNGKRWLEMIGFDKSIPHGCLEIPAEKWYYFYIAGIEKAMEEIKTIAHRFECCPHCGNEELPNNHFCDKCKEGKKGFTESMNAYWFAKKLERLIVTKEVFPDEM